MEVDEPEKQEPMEDEDMENEEGGSEDEDKLLEDDDGEDGEDGEGKPLKGVAMLRASDDYKKMREYGIKDGVAVEVMKLFSKENITWEDLDERAQVALKEFPWKDAIAMLKVIRRIPLKHVVNKSAYLCSMMKLYRHHKKNYGASAKFNPPGPDHDKLTEILEKNSYPLDITPGQRKYGPPPGWEGPAPGHGHEVVVGRIPRQYYEDKLVPLFEDFGKIYELRLMIDSHTGYNRNFCFVTFCDKDAASKACRLLNHYEVRPGKTLNASISTSKTRLYIGNIPKGKGKDEIYEEFSKLTPGIVEVILYCSPEMEEKNLKNKGYCFLEYEDHSAANTAKKKLENGRTEVWGYEVVVDWAEPQEDPDEEEMKKVKVIHIKNLSSEMTDEELREAFAKFGKIERIQKVRDYGFVHYANREDAVKAIEEMDGKPFGKFTLEVCLSKSQLVKKKRRDYDDRRGGHRMGFGMGNRMGMGGGFRDNRMGNVSRGGMGGMGGRGMGGGGMRGMGMGMRNQMAMMQNMQMNMNMMNMMGSGVPNQGMFDDYIGYEEDMDYQGGYVNTQGGRRGLGGQMGRMGMIQDVGFGGYDDYMEDYGYGGGFGGNRGRMGGGNRQGAMFPQKRKSGAGAAGWGNKRRR